MGVSENVITVLAAEEKPEGYDEETTIAEAVKEREEFYGTKLKPEIEAAYKERTEKERYAATIKPIQSRLNKQLAALGASKEEIETIKGDVGIDPKKAIDLIGTLANKATEDAAKATNSDDLIAAKAEITKWKQEASARAEELDTAKAGFEVEKQKMLSDYDAKEVARNKSRIFSDTLGGESFKSIKNIGMANEVMALYMDRHGYDIKPSEDGTSWIPVAKDGTAAISINKKNTYKTVEEMMLDVARHNHMFPEHNGGQDRQVGEGERVIDGTVVKTGSVEYLDKFLPA